MNPDDGLEIEDIVSDDTETSTVEFSIVVTSSDWTLEILANKFRDGDIIIPDYQRKFVWDIRRASTLIESFIIGLPVPQIFLYENSEGQLEVIDGQQRITSIKYFFEGYFGSQDANGNRKVFALKGLEQRKDLEGKTFADLDERTRRRIQNSSLRGVTVKQLTPDEEQPESVYHIFERLNTGGQPLNAQEIRNAVYRGPLLQELEKLNINDDWRVIYGKPDAEPNQRDIELLLRLLAFYKNDEPYVPPMKDFLSREMARNRNVDNDRVKNFINDFPRAANTIRIALNKPFRPRGLLNAATMEAVFVSLMEHGHNAILTNDSYDKLLQNDEFMRSITSNTSSVENVSTRKYLADQVLFDDA